MKDLLFVLRLRPAAALRLAAGVALMAAAALAGVGLLGLSGWFVAASALAGLGLIGRGFNYLNPSATIRTLVLVRTAARYAAQLVSHDATFRILAGLRSWFFRAAIPLSFGRLRTLRSGDLLNRITADIDALDHLFLRVLAPIAVAAVAGVAVVAVALLFDVAFGLVLVAGLVLAGVVVPWATERAARRPGQEVAARVAEARADILDGFAGATDLVVFGAADRHRMRIAAVTDRLLDRQRRLVAAGSAGRAAVLLLANLTFIAVLWLGLGRVEAGALTGPLAVGLALAALAAFDAVAPLPAAFETLGRTRAAAARLRELATAPAEPADPVDPRPMPERFDLRLEGVSHRYPGRSEAAVSGVELSVPEGARVALVGPSGSGKSTLLALMARLADPTEGAVRLGGVDLRRLALADLHRRYGVLTQQADLFQGTLRENLRIGAPDADDAALREGLDLAGLGGLVDELPEGLDTPVGELASRLSGGQARRVALARALLRRPALLLLDEPTEGLDAAAHRTVLARLLALPWRCTLVLVTHRLDGLDGFDRVLRVEEGRLSG